MGKDKYVNATELIKLAKEEMSAGFAYPEGKPTGDEDIYRQKWVFLVQVLEAANAVDVEEVIRCYDCIYHTEDDECTNGRWNNWSNSDYDELYPEALEMDYCSYGVRKDG